MKEVKNTKHKTEWNLGLLYKNEHDPQIEKDLAITEKAFLAFEKKYKGKDFVSTPQKLAMALKDHEAMMEIVDGKPIIYFLLVKDVRMSDATIAAKYSLIKERFQKASNRVVFFSLDIALIAKEKQQKYLTDKSLQHFSYFLKKIFDTAKYNLSEKEEKLISLLRQSGHSMWTDANKKLVGEQTVEHNKKRMPISEALEILADLPKQQRRNLRKNINLTLKSISFLAEAELNAICNFKKVTDEARGLKNPFTATILGYENDEKEVLSLVKSVTKKFSLSHRYYKLHAKLLGEQKITSADLYAKIGQIKKKFDLESSISIVKDAFAKFGPEYSAIVEKYFENGQIDVFPREGKRGGGYCMSNAELPVFILLNFAPSAKFVATLAHEMGHAFHAETSRKNTPLYRDYTTSVAEVASTFFEQFAAEEIEQYLSDEEKMIFLHGKIGQTMAGIMRQIACFNFEAELHDRIRKEGSLSKEAMAELMNKHMQAYMGDAVVLNPDDGYSYVTWFHLRYFFYTYSYAYGELISKTLYAKWKENKSYKAKIEQFLSAGGSMSPKDIFKSIGINTNEAFFEAGLKGIEADIVKLEKLAKKYKKI